MSTANLHIGERVHKLLEIIRREPNLVIQNMVMCGPCRSLLLFISFISKLNKNQQIYKGREVVFDTYNHPSMCTHVEIIVTRMANLVINHRSYLTQNKQCQMFKTKTIIWLNRFSIMYQVERYLEILAGKTWYGDSFEQLSQEISGTTSHQETCKPTSF